MLMVPQWFMQSLHDPEYEAFRSNVGRSAGTHGLTGSIFQCLRYLMCLWSIHVEDSHAVLENLALGSFTT